MELGERKLKILAAIVEIYVETGEPVGSKALCDALNFSVSSATIRNEMSELVELGLLEQPHTSAGRVPSNMGYRLYINKLMHKKSVPETEKKFIEGTLYASAYDPEHLLEEASQLLADITKFVAVSTSPCGSDSKIRNIQLVKISKKTSMLILMTSNGVVKNKIFRCDYDLNYDILSAFHKALNEKLCGLELFKITPEFLKNLALSFGEISVLMPSLLIAVFEASREAMSMDVCLDGQTNLLFLPEFEPNNIKEIMDLFNRRADIAKLLLSNQGRGVHVLIGSESNQPELCNSSIIIARYHLKGEDYGALGIIGPIRMDYAKVIANLEYLANTVGKLLNEILDTE